MARTLLWSQQEVAFYEKHHTLAALPASVRKKRFAHALSNYGRLVRASEPKASARALWRAWTLKPSQLSLLPQLIFSFSRALASGKPA
jgi:hypothetical protein